MTNAIETTVTVTEVTAATEATVVARTPSLKSRAFAIFQAKLVERSQGLFASNKEFRAAVLTTIEADLGVSRPSASTMYNSAKKEAEAADAAIALGRDPKKEKAVSTGKRGRPQGSKNKPKEVDVTTTETNVVVIDAPKTADEPALM